MTTEVLHIALLGKLQLTYGACCCTTPLYTVNTPRLQSLLAYLLLHRTAPLAREQLAFLFWPDTSEAQAFTNLRNLLHKLRQALPTPEHFLLIDSHFVQWQPEAPCTLDVAAFEQAVAQATTPSALAKAVELYQGELLPSCYDDWILPERERVRQLALDTLERLITLLEARRDYYKAISYSQRLLQLEPLNEALYRRLMSLHAANEDRAGALHVYQQCAVMLKEEFGAEPAPATQELAQRLQHAGALPPPSPPGIPEAPQLVGRAKEWQILLAAWQRACLGNAHCLLLAGETGSGKTRLAEEFMIWVKRQGYNALMAHCYAAEGVLAYAPIMAWLRSDPIAQSLHTLEPVWLMEVARLLPELLIPYPTLASSDGMNASWQRQRFFEALARVLLRQQGPLLLLLDDLQWCDRDTLEWLCYFLHFAQDHRVKVSSQAPLGHGRVLLLGTVCSEALYEQHPFHTLLLMLRQADQLTEVILGPLNVEETAALATAVAGCMLSPDQNAHLYQETEGNPLFVVETVRTNMAFGMREIGDEEECDRKEISASMPSFPHPLTLSPKVHAVIHARLAELSPAARELAGVAATIGRTFPFTVLAEASKQTEETLVRSLDELCQRQIVREQGTDTYDFTHDKLREAVYNYLSAARRRLYHKQVAEALAALYLGAKAADDNPTLRTISGQIAAHYELAGDDAKAIHYYQAAAEAAQHMSANQEAVNAYRQAVTLAERHHGQLADFTLSEKLGDLLHAIHHYEEARTIFAQLLSHATITDLDDRVRLRQKLIATWLAQYPHANLLHVYAATDNTLEETNSRP